MQKLEKDKTFKKGGGDRLAGQQHYDHRQCRPIALWPQEEQANSIYMAAGSAGHH